MLPCVIFLYSTQHSKLRYDFVYMLLSVPWKELLAA